MVEADVDDGAKLYKAVEAAGLHVAFAGWLRLPDENAVSLYLAIPEVEIVGPFEVYDRIAKAIGAAKIKRVSIDDVIISNARNHFTATIASALSKIEGMVRFINCDINDIYIKEMSLYKSDAEMVKKSAADFAANEDRGPTGPNRKQRRAAEAGSSRRDVRRRA